MPKNKFTNIQMISVIVLLILLLSSQWDILSSPDTWIHKTLKNPRSVTVDSSGNAYIVTEEYKRILKVGKNGILDRIFFNKPLGKGGFYWADNVNIGSDDSLFVSHQILDPQLSNTISSQIIRYDARGRYQGIVVERATRDYELILHPVYQIRGNDLIYALRTPDNVVDIRRMDMKSKSDRSLGVVPIDFDQLQWFDIQDNGKIYFTTFRAQLGVFDPASKNLGTESWMRTIHVPADIKVHKGRVYVLDLDGNRVVSAGPDGKAIVCLDGKNLQKTGYPYSNVLLRCLAPDFDGGIFTLDIRNGVILRYQPETGTLQYRHTVDRSQFSQAVLILDAAACASILSLAGILVRRFLKKSRKSVFAKQLGAFLGLFLFSVTVFTVVMYQQMDESFMTELEHRILASAQAGIQRVDVDAFEKIKGPGDDSALFKRVQDSLDASIFYNKDPWNRDLCCEAYKVRNGNLFLDYGGYYKFNDAQALRDAYEKGITAFTRYSDAYGSWLSAVTPLKNSQGHIVGVYECYIDTSLLDERNAEFLKKSLLMALFFIALFSGVFALYSHYELKLIRRLQQAVGVISDGSYDVVVDIHRNDELGDLARGFERMARSLQQYSARMESLVAQRTGELNQKVDELAAANRELQEAYSQLEVYSATIEELTTTRERSRIARELHDSISQELYSLSLKLGTVRHLLPENDPEVRSLLERIISTADKVQVEMRLMIYELQPGNLAKQGFIQSVTELAEIFTTRFRINILCDIPEAIQKLDIRVQYALYRIIQESLNNIVRHSGATDVAVIARHRDSGLILQIHDNGAGFDAGAERTGAIGLKSMQERAEEVGAEFRVLSEPGEGTTVEVHVPSEAPPAQ